MWRRGFIGALGFVACTADNPAYETGASEDAGEASTTSGVPTSSAAESAESSSSSTGAPSCELHPEQWLDISVMRDGKDVSPSCGGNMSPQAFARGRSIVDGDTIIHRECLPEDPECACTGPEIRIRLQDIGDFPIGALNCGTITLWPVVAPAGCVWGGVVLQEEASLPPVFIGANTRRVPPLGGAFTLGLTPEDSTSERCEGECPELAPGRYALDVFGTSVAADGLEHFVMLSIIPGAELTYRFENRMSSVDEGCEELVSWVTVPD